MKKIFIAIFSIIMATSVALFAEPKAKDIATQAGKLDSVDE